MADENEKTLLSEDHRKLKAAGFLGKKALLVVLSPDFFGKSCVVGGSGVIVGRHHECDLAIPDPLLSRKHCSVSIDEKGEFFLEDLGSTNSTYLNSKQLKGKTQLHYGDRIVLGNTILRFYIEEEIEKK